MAKTIGFVGLGNMGGNMAARFLAAGHTVFGEARSRDHAQHLIDSGLQWRDTPRELAEASDVVITSVPDDDVLTEVASGDEGLLAGLSAGKVWVDMSTVTAPASAASSRRRRANAARRCWTHRSREASRRSRPGR
jgi:3-hydroxyisobutyrate dehydrogenase-like beta-hydroxyacid dehydrogenase